MGLTSIGSNNLVRSNKLSQKEAPGIVRDAIEIEKEFISDVLLVKLIGMNAGLMKQYIEFVADSWMMELGYLKIYNHSIPLDFIEMISLGAKPIY
ncbi:MAG: ribonucleotide-diphosphate reductase subunit beta [Bacteroidota bacterium]|nr:ribonucleotide-diphosphate reductase subunit beta [Bacteroidota bacterium]